MIKSLALVAVLAVVALAQQQQDPPFLKNATPATKAAFYQLAQQSASLTYEQFDAKMTAFAAAHPEIKADFAAFQAQEKAAKAQADSAHNSAIAKFSPAAKAADAKLTAIQNNNALSFDQKDQQIGQIFQSLPAAVRTELEQAMRG